MTIAVASGKGGTGKTTVATNLAYVAATKKRKVQYLDCDVEEPNGHIFLKPKIDDTQDVTVEIPDVDLEKCIGCGKCGNICQFSAIVPLGEHNTLTFEQLCHSCGGCMRVCPADAITPKPLAIGEIQRGKANGVDFVSGKLVIGNVRTPSLIKRVKEHIDRDHIAIVDIPPGTSCPVVEALKDSDFVLLVTEPTPFGLNDLKLAVDLVRQRKSPFAVVINRDGIGNDEVEKFCNDQGINVVLKIPEDIRIAQAYSKGRLITDALPEYKKHFTRLFKYLETVRDKRREA